MKNRRIKQLQLEELNTNCSYCAATWPTVLPPQRHCERERGQERRGGKRLQQGHADSTHENNAGRKKSE